jgi:hypothetical protein
MRLDSSGNLGLGVTPSAWLSTNTRAAQVGSMAMFSQLSGHNADLTANAYYSATGYKYINSDYATHYQQISGQHQWHTAPSGTAGNAITFTQAMTLDASGNLGIGTTSPNSGSNVGKLSVETTQNFGISIYRSSINPAQIAFLDNNNSCAVGSNGSSSMVFFNNSRTTERMRIDDSGNLLVGRTTSDGYRIAALGNTQLTSGIQMTYEGVAASSIGVSSSSAMVFGFDGATGSTERMRIDSNGNLLVGATSDVTNGGFKFFTNYSRTGSSAVEIGHINGSSSGEGYAGFKYNGSTIGSITQSGTTAVLYNLTSDARLKTNIEDANSASSLIDAIQVRKYDWKAEGSHQRYGFIAQELVNVVPEAVHQPQDLKEMMAVDYSKLVPLLVKEIQELRIRVALLESK